LTLATLTSKYVVLLVVDDEGREDSWMNQLMKGRVTVDFVIPEVRSAALGQTLQPLHALRLSRACT
jgi:hypothetical protein